MPYDEFVDEVKTANLINTAETEKTALNPEYYYGSGGILLADMIEHEYENGRIEISPFDKSKINPNSYNVTLSRTLKKYDIYRPSLSELSMFGGLGMVSTPDYLKCIDSKKNNKTVELVIPDDGLILQPGILYIGTTEEIVGSDYYIPIINGRSSIGRLGMCVHVTAGFGDIGFKGQWTLEISVIEPLKIYPDMEIAQIAFYSPVTSRGYDVKRYDGRYQGQEGATASRYYMGKDAKAIDAEPEKNVVKEEPQFLSVLDRIVTNTSEDATVGNISNTFATENNIRISLTNGLDGALNIDTEASNKPVRKLPKVSIGREVIK